MLSEQRRDAILEQLRLEGAVRTTGLAKSLGVTEETIRKDLERLEEEDKLRRTHGGAVSNSDLRDELDYMEREGILPDAKERIAKLAVQLIEPKSIIFLDASTTAYALAKILPDIPVTVLTNAQKVLYCLIKRQNIKLVAIGGSLDRRSLSFFGAMATESLARFNIDQCFFSCRGIDLNRGLSEARERQADIKRTIIHQSSRPVLLADHTKFGAAASYFFAPATALDAIVTDRPPETSYQSYAQQHGIDLRF